MGAIGSICCSEEKNNKNDKNNETSSPLQPTVPVSTHKKSQQKKLDEFKEQRKQSKQKIQSKDPYLTQVGNDPGPAELQALPKGVDVVDVIEKLYPAPKPIKWESFNILGRLGKGGFGEVYLAELIDNKQNGIDEKYAIKRVSKSDVYLKKLSSNIKLEKKILQESKSKFITTLHYAFRDERCLYFVMEWAQGGDTYTLIDEGSPRLNDFKKAGESAVRFILGCLILGMEYLHSNKIMYRDLKPENILMFDNGYAKLTDFGLAKQIKEDQLARTEAGTTIYYAPEMVAKQGYNKMVDIWAIGVYAYEMSNYNPPFASADIRDKLKVKRIVKNAQKKRNWKNPNLSQELKDFINSILRLEPERRLGFNGFDEMKQHSFFKSVNFDWQALEEMKMESPLKPILEKHRSKPKPYILNEKQKRGGPYDGKGEQVDGWTYDPRGR